ncbi:MAG TPA: DUF3108 domain-containing protein [Burkholderiales bacterium]|nr:DUF3108 domain-containing protein [Burkholderiales bacterium]
MNRLTLNAAGIALACFLALAAPLAASAPKSVRATYNGFMNGMSIGVISEQFESDGTNYRIVSDTKPMGLAAFVQRQPLRFSSTGQVARDGLKPVRFEARRTAGESPQVAADFDWGQSQIVLKHHGKTESFALSAGTQDRLSVMYQFMYLPPDRLRVLEFAMTNGRKVDRYRYRATPDVEIDTGLGRLKTLHLVKQREPGDTVTEVWLSPQHQHLPVKMLIVEKDGMRFEQVIQNLELRD